MKKLKTLFVCFAVLALASCTEKSDDLNSAPGEFSVTLSANMEKLVVKDVAKKTVSPSELVTPTSSLKVTWTEAVDPDGDAVTYDVYVNNVLTESDLTDKEATISFTSDEKVTVKIVAKDPEGKTTSAEAINNTPGEFSVTLTEEGGELVVKEAAQRNVAPSGSLTVTWTEAVDPDGDTVTYDVYVNNTLTKTNLTTKETSISYNPNANVTVKVTAKDTKGATSSAEKTKTVSLEVGK